MKKFLVLFSLVLFLGAYTAPLNAINNGTAIVIVDEDKCPKCGKEKCDDTCEAVAKSEQQAAAGKSVKAKSDCQKSCDNKKNAACTTKNKEKKSAEVK